LTAVPNGTATAVVFGGPSPEHDVSVLTGLQAAHELDRIGRPVTALYWSKTGEWYRVEVGLEASAFVEGVPRHAEPVQLVACSGGGFVSGGRFGRARTISTDVVVNCCHGGPGEDGSLQAAMDLAGVSYTGPTASGAALGMDKLAFSGAMAAAGLSVLPRRLLDGSVDTVDFSGPFIVKPRFGGSSIGIDVVADLDTARARLGANPHLRQGAVIEPFRDDLEDLNVAVRTWPQIDLSAIERPIRSNRSAEILDYSDKYVGGEGMASAPREVPADIPTGLAGELRSAALKVGRLCGARGMARIDFLSDGSTVFVNEINTVPGSLARYLWVDPPVSFGQMLGDMIDEALERPAVRLTAVGADGAVLRSAGSIASKLG
jgi:D-alanine-D-alanine ligase